MISKRPVKGYCCEDISKIENYDKAVADTTQMWDCHHRLETHNSDGERRSIDITKKELIALDMYYHRPSDELIFLKHDEHRRLHYISKILKGKPYPEEWRRRNSEANRVAKTRVITAYREYKANGGEMKWNEFQKQRKDLQTKNNS